MNLGTCHEHVWRRIPMCSTGARYGPAINPRASRCPLPAVTRDATGLPSVARVRQPTGAQVHRNVDVQVMSKQTKQTRTSQFHSLRAFTYTMLRIPHSIATRRAPPHSSTPHHTTAHHSTQYSTLVGATRRYTRVRTHTHTDTPKKHSKHTYICAAYIQFGSFKLAHKHRPKREDLQVGWG